MQNQIEKHVYIIQIVLHVVFVLIDLSRMFSTLYLACAWMLPVLSFFVFIEKWTETARVLLAEQEIRKERSTEGRQEDGKTGRQEDGKENRKRWIEGNRQIQRNLQTCRVAINTTTTAAYVTL